MKAPAQFANPPSAAYPQNWLERVKFARYRFEFMKVPQSTLTGPWQTAHSGDSLFVVASFHPGVKFDAKPQAACRRNRK
jgi:hypothetical protein